MARNSSYGRDAADGAEGPADNQATNAKSDGFVGV